MWATVVKNRSRPKTFLGTIGDRANAKSHPWVTSFSPDKLFSCILCVIRVTVSCGILKKITKKILPAHPKIFPPKKIIKERKSVLPNLTFESM